jgi:uncharacterized membrane protein
METIIAVNFDDDSKVYTALTSLGELGQQHRVELGSAAIVERSQDGPIETKEQIADSEYEGTAVGGFMGLLLGVIGGPLGVLIGGATGVMVGSLFDLDEEDATDSALSAVSRSVRPDHLALIAVVNERTPEVVDAAMAEHGGTVRPPEVRRRDGGDRRRRRSPAAGQARGAQAPHGGAEGREQGQRPGEGRRAEGEAAQGSGQRRQQLRARVSLAGAVGRDEPPAAL